MVTPPTLQALGSWEWRRSKQKDDIEKAQSKKQMKKYPSRMRLKIRVGSGGLLGVILKVAGREFCLLLSNFQYLQCPSVFLITVIWADGWAGEAIGGTSWGVAR